MYRGPKVEDNFWNLSSDRIKQLRTHLKLTQIEFAKRLNVSPRTVQKWENGIAVPEKITLYGIAYIYNVSADWLVNGDGKLENAINDESYINIIEWLKSLNKNEQSWLYIEIQTRFPAFKEWLDHNSK